MLFKVLYKHRHITQEWLWEIKIAICFYCGSGFSHLWVSPRSVRGFSSPPVLTCHWHVVAKTYWEEAFWQVQACPHSDKCNIPVTQVTPPARIPVSFLTVCNSRYIQSAFLSLFFFVLRTYKCLCYASTQQDNCILHSSIIHLDLFFCFVICSSFSMHLIFFTKKL